MEVAAPNGFLLEREVLVGAQVVHPQLIGPGLGATLFLSKKITFAFTPGEYQIPVGKRSSVWTRHFCKRLRRTWTLLNTFIFTLGSQVLGLVLGKFGALMLLRPFPGRKLVRALIILPWAVPIAIATVAWEWMFDSLYSVINWTLIALGILTRSDAPNWLGDPQLAMLCVIIVNAWRFFPFAIVIFLAGITAVPQDVIDAATVDGAGFWRRNYQIIVPMIAPIVVVGLIFGTVFTFTDLSIVYLLTMGGPVSATSVLGLGAHAVLVLDQAGWHLSDKLIVPPNITLVPLPPKCPELAAVLEERVKAGFSRQSIARARPVPRDSFGRSSRSQPFQIAAAAHSPPAAPLGAVRHSRR